MRKIIVVAASHLCYWCMEAANFFNNIEEKLDPENRYGKVDYSA
jgi:hypothetical protein